MTRLALILVFVGMLLLLPALCAGGWLTHPCECGSAVSCEHESDCGSDPCELDMAQAGPDAQATGESSAATTKVGDTDRMIGLATVPAGPRPNASAPLAQGGRPFPLSDLPLLN